MHTKHGGTDSYFYASACAVLRRDVGVSMEELNTLLKEHRPQQHASSCFTKVTVSMFQKLIDPEDHFPFMKGQCSEIKLLGQQLYGVFQAKMNRESRVHNQILLGIKFSIGMDALLDDTDD